MASQRYPFCAEAFVHLINEYGDTSKYCFSYNETDMERVISSVAERKSEIGVIFLSEMTEKFTNKILAVNDLEFHEITRVKPHVFINRSHPLAGKTTVKARELFEYPYVAFTKKNNNTIQFSEEAILPEIEKFKKVVYVNDRASCYNVLVNTNCVSTGSGILPDGYGDDRLISVPIEDALDIMRLGWIKQKDAALSEAAEKYIEILGDILA